MMHLRISKWDCCDMVGWNLPTFCDLHYFILYFVSGSGLYLQNLSSVPKCHGGGAT